MDSGLASALAFFADLIEVLREGFLTSFAPLDVSGAAATGAGDCFAPLVSATDLSASLSVSSVTLSAALFATAATFSAVALAAATGGVVSASSFSSR